MRIILLALIVFFSLTHLLFAGVLKDEKRIEEETRQRLRPTEIRPAETTQPVPENTALSSDQTYFYALASKKYMLRADILKPLLLLIGEAAFSQDQPAQIELLKTRNIIPAKVAAAFSPDKPLHRGLAAYMLCRALDIKGGIGWRLFPSSQRYALNELVFAGIMKRGSVHDVVSGREFIAAFTNAVNYMAACNEALKNKKSQQVR